MLKKTFAISKQSSAEPIMHMKLPWPTILIGKKFWSLNLTIVLLASNANATEERLYRDIFENVQNAIVGLYNQLQPVNLVSVASNQKHYFITAEDCNYGYNPYQDKFVHIVKNHQPSDAQIFRCAVSHQGQRLFNLPLSILNVLKFTEALGCSGTMLKNVLITFLNKHQPELIDDVDPHTLSTRCSLENISYHINTSAEKSKATTALTNFQRSMGQPFSAAITYFETLFTFFIQLDNVVSVEETNRLNLSNLNAMAPYLISRKCRPIFLEFAKEKIRSNTPPTKTFIFRVSNMLIANQQLQIGN